MSVSWNASVPIKLLPTCPVITTSGTPWSIIEEKNCGWLIEPKINEAVKGAIKKNLNNDKGFPDLFKDLGDKLDFDQSMRNFNINPNTQIPNDQDKFLNFLYGNLPSEKNVNVY